MIVFGALTAFGPVVFLKHYPFIHISTWHYIVADMYIWIALDFPFKIIVSEEKGVFI